MMVPKLKKMYLPAFLIVMVVLVLLVFISISTYRNLDREERNVTDFLHRQGFSLIHALAAGARTGDDTIDTLFQETAESEDIAYIYTVDSQGKMTHHSDQSLIGTAAPEHIRFDPRGRVLSNIHKLSGDLRIYEMITPFIGKTDIVLGIKMVAFDEARKADLVQLSSFESLLRTTPRPPRDHTGPAPECR